LTDVCLARPSVDAQQLLGRRVIVLGKPVATVVFELGPGSG
jgi:hypothetical protein